MLPTNLQIVFTEISCGIPSAIKYAHIHHVSGYGYGGSATYVCEDGSMLEPAGYVYCTLNGTWEPTQECIGLL